MAEGDDQNPQKRDNKYLKVMIKIPKKGTFTNPCGSPPSISGSPKNEQGNGLLSTDDAAVFQHLNGVKEKNSGGVQADWYGI